MPELKQCPACQIKAGKAVIRDYNPFDDKIYDVKFLCLTCDRIYQNVKDNLLELK